MSIAYYSILAILYMELRQLSLYKIDAGTAVQFIFSMFWLNTKGRAHQTHLIYLNLFLK